MNQIKAALSLMAAGLPMLLAAQEQNPPVASNTEDADSTLMVHQLDDVVVNALRVGHNAPFAHANINKKEIKELNTGVDLPFLLDQTASVLVNSDAGNGVGYTDIRIRGTDNNRINLTINGVPINDPESQGVFFVNFPDVASSTSSIQIQRGVGASTNGSGAFGASINISNLAQEYSASARLSNSVGSYGLLRHSLNLASGMLKGGFQFDLRLSKISSDGYVERSSADLKSFQFLAGWRSKNNKSRLKFNLFSGTEKTGQAWNGVLEQDLAENRRMNELGLKEDGTYYRNQTDNYQQDYYQLFWDQQLSHHWDLNTGIFLTRGKGYYDEYRIDEKYSDYFLPSPVIGGDTIPTTSLTRQLWLDNYYYGVLLNLKYRAPGRALVLGGSALQYDAKHYGYVNWAANGGVPEAYQWYHLPAYKNDANIYAKAEQQFGLNWLGTLDLQYRYVNYEIQGFRKNIDIRQENVYGFFNPKAGITYLGARSRAYFSFAMAGKEPNRNDFEAGIVEVPKPERLYDYELGYQYFSKSSSFSANLYYMFYRDQLILTGKINDVGAYTRSNVDESYRAGIELEAKHRFSKKFSAFANATLSQNKIKAFTEYIDDYDNGGQQEVLHKNTDIALSPNAIAQAGISYEPFDFAKDQSLRLSLHGKYVSRQYLDNTSNNGRSIQPYTLFNFNLNYTTSLFKQHDVSIIAGVNNLLNKKYESKGYTFSYYWGGLQTYNYYFPQAGRNYNLTLVLEI